MFVKKQARTVIAEQLVFGEGKVEICKTNCFAAPHAFFISTALLRNMFFCGGFILCSIRATHWGKLPLAGCWQDILLSPACGGITGYGGLASLYCLYSKC